MLTRVKDVPEKRLVRKDGADVPGRVTHDQLEQAESRSSGGTDAGRDDLADHGGGRPGTETADGDQMRPIFVPEWESKQKIFGR